MATLMLGAFATFAACGNDEKKDNNQTYEESSTFALYVNGQRIEAGGTVEAVPTAEEVRNDFAHLDINVENKSGFAIPACISLSKVEGPATMDKVEICYNGACRQHTCPFTSDPFTMEAGLASANTITYDYTPSAITSTVIYRLTVGEGTSMANPQVLFIKHSN